MCLEPGVQTFTFRIRIIMDRWFLRLELTMSWGTPEEFHLVILNTIHICRHFLQIQGWEHLTIQMDTMWLFFPLKQKIKRCQIVNITRSEDLTLIQEIWTLKFLVNMVEEGRYFSPTLYSFQSTCVCIFSVLFVLDVFIVTQTICVLFYNFYKMFYFLNCLHFWFFLYILLLELCNDVTYITMQHFYTYFMKCIWTFFYKVQ